jgi:hypothetical protein
VHVRLHIEGLAACWRVLALHIGIEWCELKPKALTMSLAWAVLRVAHDVPLASFVLGR